MNGLKIKRICKNCGKEFDALAIKVRQGKALFCCKECYNHTIQTDLNGLAAYIGAVAGVFASAGITKAWSEKYEKK